ncbi:MAG: 5-formyltetrahydrofolate cyclo-ligase [Sulfurovum sp.]|nr:MAG: 5-formyltetrahydrofolate cyclo-ligase [Sulfurovum sp.]
MRAKERTKASFRKECLHRLRRASKKNGYKRDKLVVSALYDYLQAQKAQTIMLYLPLGTEVDVAPLIRRLRQEGKSVYVPFMEGESFRLVKYRYPLYKKKFGVKEPKYSRQYRSKKIDIAIVPIVGVDAAYRRIGFGKGMYDRFFEKEMKNIKKVVFVARELCYAKEVITDHYDVKADHIIAP